MDVFGCSYDKQHLSGQGCSTPMLSRTEHANELAACNPFPPTELRIAQTGETYGFVFCHVFGGCMHCALWTRLDILTACLVLSQYQAAPGALHFRALKHLVGYLGLHSDIPLLFDRATVAKEILSIQFELLEPTTTATVHGILLEIAPPSHNVPFDSDPKRFTSCNNLF
jgi:hypothetical protein